MDSALRALLDREAIIDVMNRYAAGVDGRDAKLYRSCFSDVIDTDMLGNAQQGIAADDWVEQVLSAVSIFETTQHMITNHTVRSLGDDRNCVAYVQATHWRPEGAWLVGGTYDNDLRLTDDGWRIYRLSLTMTWEERTGSL